MSSKKKMTEKQKREKKLKEIVAYLFQIYSINMLKQRNLQLYQDQALR